MKSIDINTLQVGSTAETDYLSPKGDVLISRGMTITEKHIQFFTRRSMFEVFVEPESEEEEIQSLLEKEFDSLGEVDLDEEPEPPPKNPVLKGVKMGMEGIKQLQQSELSLDLDKRLRNQRTPDRPFGPALKDKITQVDVSERTDTYKVTMSTSYERALQDVRYVLDSIADGRHIDGKQIRAIATRFVEIFISDKNILLNLSAIKPDTNDYIYHHSLNVCLLAINIAASYGYNHQQVIEIGMGALLHDIGMLLIPKKVRVKNGRLNEQEWFEVLKHPILGLHALEGVKSLPETLPYIAYQVHERENGRGYPKQRNARLIHRFAKMVQIADVYEALSSPRAYRAANMPYRSMEMLIKMSRTNIVSKEFVKAFLEYAALFPVGSLVELSNKSVARVIDANRTSFAKPVVSVLTDEKGKRLAPEKIYQIDLYRNTSQQITRALASDHLEGLDLMDGF